MLLEGEAPGLEAHGYYAPPHATFASGCHAAIVEVDVETGNLAFLRYVVQHDCGTLVNPIIVEGQIRGGVAQGIGGSFFERIVYDESGQPLTSTFMDFLIPTAMEIPDIAVGHMETRSPLNALGVKGVGEAGAIPVPALVAEAIDDALAPLGVRIREMPLSPSRLRELISAARGGADARCGARDSRRGNRSAMARGNRWLGQAVARGRSIAPRTSIAQAMSVARAR